MPAERGLLAGAGGAADHEVWPRREFLEQAGRRPTASGTRSLSRLRQTRIKLSAPGTRLLGAWI